MWSNCKMIILGLGSNISDPWGDRIGYLRKAIQLLRSRSTSPGIEVICISPIYESDALLPEGAPESWNRPYFNLCVHCETDLDPRELLKALKKIEQKVGRQDRGRWAPREIDIDILAYDHLQYESSEVKIPHPALLERPFAIFPFADIAPDWKIEKQGPHQGKTAAQFVSEWKVRGQIPFSTRRSTLFISQLVGILNLTPDSFSDGGKFQSPDAALEQTRRLIAEGTQILDIGAESTRPGAMVIKPDEEWKRIEPVLETLNSHLKRPLQLSLDTRNSEVATRAIQKGIHWINDVSGFSDPKMIEAVRTSSSDLVMMHSLTVPAERDKVLPHNCDPTSTLLEWAEKRIDELTASGIDRDRLIFDPGLGFGKTPEQSWEILRKVDRLHDLGIRILIGHSRKSFLSTLTSLPASGRDIETLTLTLQLAAKGIDYIRVHDVGLNTRGLRTWSQVDGVSRCRN